MTRAWNAAPVARVDFGFVTPATPRRDSRRAARAMRTCTQKTDASSAIARATRSPVNAMRTRATRDVARPRGHRGTAQGMTTRTRASARDGDARGVEGDVHDFCAVDSRAGARDGRRAGERLVILDADASSASTVSTTSRAGFVAFVASLAVSGAAFAEGADAGAVTDAVPRAVDVEMAFDGGAQPTPTKVEGENASEPNAKVSTMKAVEAPPVDADAGKKSDRGKGRLKELQDLREELLTKEYELQSKANELQKSDQTVQVLQQELELKNKLYELVKSERDRAIEEAKLASGLCAQVGGF